MEDSSASTGASLTNPNTPSRLRPPKARKPMELDTSIANENTPLVNMEDSVSGALALESGLRKSPRLVGKSINAPALPPEIPPPSIVGDRMVKTFKTSAAATSRPPVTKLVNSRPPPRTAASGKASLPKYDVNSAITITNGQRPLWDKSGRLEEMAKELEAMKARMETASTVNSTFSSRIAEAQINITAIEEENQVLMAKVKQRNSEIESLEENLRKLGRQLENERTEADETLNHVRNKLERELADIISVKERLESELAFAKNELQIAREEIFSLKSTISKQSISILESQSRIENFTEINSQLGKELSFTREQFTQAIEEISLLKKKLYDGETLRRKLHNMVQELKGNIRVFCRIRPLLRDEIPLNGDIEAALKHVTCQFGDDEREEITLVQSSESASGNAISKAYPFTFDKVFNWNAKQGQVFEEISQLIQSALDGYRVCIFAYGQTGSGKTFTMEGRMDDLEDAGMIPRAVQQIFKSTEALKERGWTFRFECSYLEIYNETIRDLLNNKPDLNAKYDIRHAEGQTMVTDLLVVPVTEPNEIMSILRKAAANRAVGETQCNERSSRSHSVFTLKIGGVNEITTEKIEGILHLIDLAGSERLSQSGSTGDRLKETQAINKSLSSLGDVIHALATKEAHIPYRNSKLTFLLQNSLGIKIPKIMSVINRFRW